MCRLTPLCDEFRSTQHLLLFKNLHIRHLTLLSKVLLQTLLRNVLWEVLHEKTRTHLGGKGIVKHSNITRAFSRHSFRQFRNEQSDMHVRLFPTSSRRSQMTQINATMHHTTQPCELKFVQNWCALFLLFFVRISRVFLDFCVSFDRSIGN